MSSKRCACYKSRKERHIQCPHNALTGSLYCGIHGLCKVNMNIPSEGLSETGEKFIGIDKFIKNMPMTDKCNMDGTKVIPFIVRATKNTGHLCNTRSDILGRKILNMVIAVLFNGSADKLLRVYIPRDLVMNINKCRENLVVIHFSLLDVLDSFSHSNILIINRERLEIEHFEPLGLPFFDPHNKITQIIFDHIIPLFPDYDFIPTIDYCPIKGVSNKGVSDKDFDERCASTGGAGFCGGYTSLYAFMRVLNPTFMRDDVAKYISTISFSQMRKFVSYVDSVVSDNEIDRWLSDGQSY